MQPMVEWVISVEKQVKSLTVISEALRGTFSSVQFYINQEHMRIFERFLRKLFAKSFLKAGFGTAVPMRFS